MRTKISISPVARHQTHRGLAPQDERLFTARQLPALRAAAADLCWLLDRGYASRSAVELVGNRHNLTCRQRMAVSRHACAHEDVQRRQKLRVEPGRLQGQELWLDGYNVLTVLESALAGGIVLLCRDGCCRDIAGIHRRYRKIDETIPVLRLIGETAAAGWNMEVELSFSPDHVLSHTAEIIATSDGIVLDRCQRWVNLARLIIAERLPQTRLLDLSWTGL
jgi:hypothetical protein